MFDMSWGEIMVIGGVALIVIGPKDLPKALRTVGQMTTKIRRMAGEFQTQFNDAMREAELEDVRREVEGLNRQVSSAASSTFNPIQTIRDELRGAVESKPSASAVNSEPTEWASSQPAAAADALEREGMTAELPAAKGVDVPATPVESTASLSDLPAVPEAPVPDPSHLMTGPGLEPLVETDGAASRVLDAAPAVKDDAGPRAAAAGLAGSGRA